MSWTMRRQFWFVEIKFVKNRQLEFFFFNPPHSALFFDRTLSLGCLRALRLISEVCCVFLIYKSSFSPHPLASSSFLQHFRLFSSIKISKHPQIRIPSKSLKSFNQLLSLSNPLPQMHIVYILQIFKFIVYLPPQRPQTWSSNRLPLTIYCTEIFYISCATCSPLPSVLHLLMIDSDSITVSTHFIFHLHWQPCVSSSCLSVS